MYGEWRGRKLRRGERRGRRREGGVLIHCKYLATVQINIATSIYDNLMYDLCPIHAYMYSVQVYLGQSYFMYMFLCFTGSDHECR